MQSYDLAVIEAAELLHIVQAVFTLKGKVTYFVDTVFNDPTLAECYKAAVFNGLNRLRLDAPAGVVGEGAGGFELGVGNEVFAGFVSARLVFRRPRRDCSGRRRGTDRSEWPGEDVGELRGAGRGHRGRCRD